jgi:hypothetical protein
MLRPALLFLFVDDDAEIEYREGRAVRRFDGGRKGWRALSSSPRGRCD